MTTRKLPGIAIIADAHLHDIESDYDGAATLINGQRLTLRSWADTRKSSRVFNESGAALRAALTAIAHANIKQVVLLGDYTDDGQIEATTRLVALLNTYRDQFGMAFFATPGNHDVFGPSGKHQSTRFAQKPGTTVLVTSDADVAKSESARTDGIEVDSEVGCNTDSNLANAIVTPGMYCQGTPDGLRPMADFGFFRQPDYLHWETPFGLDDAVESRQYQARSTDGLISHWLMDASYLVEPVEGLWLMMIDANVFEPRNGRSDPSRKKAFYNSSDAGWNALLRIKPFLIDWISDVNARASRLGKHLLAFSHYPMVDPFNDKSNSELKLFGNNETTRRRPAGKVASTVASTGLKVHFGGHLHVNATTVSEHGSHELTHIAVPSLVAFPACYKIIYPDAKQSRIETISLASIPCDSLLLDYYRAEMRATDCTDITGNSDETGETGDPALEAENYGDFLYKRMYSRVLHHYLPREWPAPVAQVLPRTSAFDLACVLLSQRVADNALEFEPLQALTHVELTENLQTIAAQYGITLKALSDCPMTRLVVDWYCLRQAGKMPTGFIQAEQLELYRFLQLEFGDESLSKADTSAAFLSIFISQLKVPDAPGTQGESFWETIRG